MVLTIMILALKSLSNTSLHVKEDFRKGKDSFWLGLNRRHQWWMIQSLSTRKHGPVSPDGLVVRDWINEAYFNSESLNFDKVKKYFLVKKIVSRHKAISLKQLNSVVFSFLEILKLNRSP
jgi:hypothetical protein